MPAPFGSNARRWKRKRPNDSSRRGVAVWRPVGRIFAEEQHGHGNHQTDADDEAEFGVIRHSLAFPVDVNRSKGAVPGSARGFRALQVPLLNVGCRRPLEVKRNASKGFIAAEGAGGRRRRSGASYRLGIVGARVPTAQRRVSIGEFCRTCQISPAATQKFLGGIGLVSCKRKNAHLRLKVEVRGADSAAEKARGFVARPSLLLGPTRRDPLSRQTDEGGLPCDPLGPPYGASALAILAATGGASQAAWNNVFEACCWNSRSSTTAAVRSAASLLPAAATMHHAVRPCRYYQPVTTYTHWTYYEPVTTLSHQLDYYEPVTSYRYSCADDPCTCRYQQVATPTTSYRLRSQSCPVTSYMQRRQVTPVQSYRQAFYYEPVTNCCQTTAGPLRF